ncbi:ABC transporter permease [Paenibacillus kobensis]|uniref:ABC transporter permease n=1 Tax=Paenibacillus kobensis TaxID=59841 RepID=UPI000FD85708|nr:ABC-2 family transporter protein [Paenibacillus kobensis]
MRTFAELLRLFYYQSKLKIARAMMYRFDFLIGMTVALLFSSIGPVLQYLIFTQTKGFPGWNLKQIILFQGVLLFVLGIRRILFGDLHYFIMELIQKGDLDRLLIKPSPAIGIILSNGFNLNGIGTFLAGSVIMGYSIYSLDLTITAGAIGLFVLSILFGIVLFMALEILFTCAVIVLVNIGRLDDIVQSLTGFGEYPLSIFTSTLKIALVTFIPFAVWVNYPADALLHRWDNAQALVSFLFCILLFAFSLWIWKFCLRRYTSAGG